MNLFNGEFSYQSPEHGRGSVCHLNVEQAGEGGYLVTATELGTNPGPSVTNSWPGLAAAVCTRVLPDAEPQSIQWVERYTVDSYLGARNKAFVSPDAHVLLPIIGRDPVRFGQPKWRVCAG